MGNFTLIELNHDRWGEIGEDPEVFVKLILEHLRDMKPDGTRIPAGEIVHSGSRYDDWYTVWKRWLASRKPPRGAGG